ncbi:MAG: hypothetical protein LBC52_01935 [Treponema sp.]|nr:hypothetical protein [Treponema sp.]
MKKIAVVCLFLICAFIMVSCNLTPQVAVLVIRNNSGQEVKDLTFTYEHSRPDQTKTIKIASLPNNESVVRELELVGSSPAIGAGMVSVPGKIEYSINGVEFNMDKGEGYIDLSDGNKTAITILADGWKAAREK